MMNGSNSVSYLIIYLIIILVLIYAITFMSSYTCNISQQPMDIFAKDGFKNYDDKIENFESASVNWNSSQIGTDYPGNDITSGNSTSSQDCGNQCIANPQCNAFVTNATGTNCWLKGNLSSPTPNSDRNTYQLSRIGAYATGSKVGNPQVGTDYPSNDIINQGVNSAQDCATACQNQSGCNAFVTNLAGNYCWLKGSVGQTTSNSDRVSYTFNRYEPLASGSNIGTAQTGIDYPGNDIINESSNSAQDCATKCQLQADCNAFVTNADGSYCWLKGSLGQGTPNTDRVSYKFNRPPPGTMSAPPISPNDFTLVAVGYANQVYLQDVIGGQWYPNSPVVQNSQAVIDLTVMPNGSLIGIGADNQLYLRQTLNSAWVNMQIAGNYQGVSIANDRHTLLLAGLDGQIYTYDLNNKQPAQKISPAGGVRKVIQLQDNSYLLVGGGGYDTLYTSNDLTKGWNMASKSDIGITSIAQTPSGQIIGLGPSGFVYTKGNDWNTWNKTVCGNFSAIAVMPLPPQKIMGYDRKGAFIDSSSSRTIPNLVGNFNTLPECINAALSQGYNTVGYQNTNYCFGGNNSPYDTYGFQTDNTKSISAYPGNLTNIVYKTTQELVTTADPSEGEVYIYEKCQFSGSGSKMIVGNYPDFGDSVPIQSVKVGINTNLILYQLPNYQGSSVTINGYSDLVNKNVSCNTLGSGTFSSAKVTSNSNAMPYNSADLTNSQLVNLWTSVGCNAESTVINDSKSITYWKNTLKTTAEVEADMKDWATDNDPTHKVGCYTAIPSPDTPGEGEVVLFEACNYGERYKKFGLGNFAYVGNDFDKITSAIKIGPYTSITIYENSNYGGKSLIFKNDSSAISGISCLTANNFNDLLSSLKVNPAFEPVNNYLSQQADDVFVLGPYYMFPWNLQNFIDKNAQWIWWNQWCGGSKGYQSCSGSAPIDPKPVRFQLLVPVSGNLDIPVVIHVISDNAPQNANIVKVNNKIVGQIEDYGWINSKYSQIDTMLAPGNNLIEFDVQNTTGGAGLLVSIINANTNEVIANSGNGKWGWVDPSKVVTVEMSKIDSTLVIHDEAAIGKIIKIKNVKELQEITIGGTFRLVVELKDVPPYIKGQQFNKGDTNEFYLAIEKLDPNCSITEDNGCLNVYADNKKCSNNALTNITKKNSFRLVLVSKDYVLDPNIPFGKNVDFTMSKIGDKYYLKNIQTGFMPKLYKNDFKQDVYGYIDTGYLSNYNSLNKNTNNLCKNDKPIPDNKKQMEQENKISKITESEFVSCTANADGNMYLMTTSNLLESNPINFVVNKDGSVAMSLQMFNFYGTLDQSYSLVFCNFNINTYAYIEKLTNPLGTFLVNMVCFDSDKKRRLPNNTLNFKFEISKYPIAYLKEKNIYNLNN